MTAIQLENHNEKWSLDYADEINAIKNFLLENIIACYHIGSTAIDNIRAKPVIDILIAVKSIERIEQYNNNFKALGYCVKGEFGITGRRFFQKGINTKTHHVHIFEIDNPEIERHRLFVEYLNAHPQHAIAYESLKLSLVKIYQYDPDNYLQGKSKFINEIDSKARSWKEKL